MRAHGVEQDDSSGCNGARYVDTLMRLTGAVAAEPAAAPSPPPTDLGDDAAAETPPP
jgi:hypothetical protein